MAGKSLIVYYSRTGNTRRVAEAIAAATGGTLCEIEAVEAYPASYHAAVEQAQKEISQGVRPAIRVSIESLAGYDTVFVGTPNWWSALAPPVATFLTRFNLDGKTVVPFCTHGGGGAGHIGRDVDELCAGAKVLPCLALRGGGDAEVAGWLRKNGLLER